MFGKVWKFDYDWRVATLGRPRQPANEIFSIKRRFQQFKARPLGSRRPV